MATNLEYANGTKRAFNLPSKSFYPTNKTRYPYFKCYIYTCHSLLKINILNYVFPLPNITQVLH